jgi:hypothetical protein
VIDRSIDYYLFGPAYRVTCMECRRFFRFVRVGFDIGPGPVGDARGIPVCNRPPNARLFMGRGSYMDKMLYVLRRMGLPIERVLLSPWLVPG